MAIPTKRDDKTNSVVPEKIDPEGLIDFSIDETAEGAGKHYQTDRHKATLKAIERRANELERKYGRDSMQGSRVISGEILMNAPEDFFVPYREELLKITGSTQADLSSSDTRHFGSDSSEAIREAQEDPTNEEKQDRAFSFISQYANSKIAQFTRFRGVERKILLSMVTSEIIGFSVLDPLWRDARIDEILCNGPYDVQVEINGILHKVPAASFIDRDHLMRLLERLYRAINRQIATKTPIAGGRLHDNSRMQAVHHVVAPEGPLFSIRKHKEDYIPPQKIVDFGTANEDIMEFLGNIIYREGSVLVIGGTGSGKTTLLGALSGFIRDTDRIVTIEDNIELKLPKHKLLAPPMESIESHPDMPNSGVTIRQLVKASLRLRPNAIILGEVRDSAAYDLVQALNTGHYGMSTLHSNSESNSIFRLASLISEGGGMSYESALSLISAAFDVIVRIERYPDGSRKISSISEVSPVVTLKDGHGELKTRVLWRYEQDKTEDDSIISGRWVQLHNISSDRAQLKGFDKYSKLSWDELCKLATPDVKK